MNQYEIEEMESEYWGRQDYWREYWASEVEAMKRSDESEQYYYANFCPETDQRLNICACFFCDRNRRTRTYWAIMGHEATPLPCQIKKQAGDDLPW